MTRRPGGPATGAAGDEQGGWGVDQISVEYRGQLALDRITLHAAPGQVTAVVGGDGAGKTTLLRCLAGALAPGSGQVRRPAARQIGYLPGSPGTYPDLTVRENLDFRAAAYRLPVGQARERSGDLLERAGLAAVRDRLAGQLSGGMRQKLGVIAAMLTAPRLLVLDEPTTGVDPVSRSGMWWPPRVTVLETPDWAAAFAALGEARMPVALAGRTLRVPGATSAEVRRALSKAGSAGARACGAPATLEERFFQLVLPRSITEPSA